MISHATEIHTYTTAPDETANERRLLNATTTMNVVEEYLMGTYDIQLQIEYEYSGRRNMRTFNSSLGLLPKSNIHAQQPAVDDAFRHARAKKRGGNHK